MAKKKQKKRKKKKSGTVPHELKEEVARELGFGNDIEDKGWANLTSRETGKIGGHIAKKLRKKKEV
ncbi:MAG: alpha/beta-type small acid-soluble spore protein [Firmicutes bacterium]|nr:alpha/beta-type small acid-soluble spore protein [Bacillota bacterium]